jgi:transcriptional regulator
MYIPQAFEVTDRETLHAFIEANSFATLVTSVDGAPFATRLPLLLDRDAGARGTLLGHLARANPHWRGFDARAQALAMFDGPHGYISPSWYVASPAVPTWNYAAVHAYGAPRVIEDPRRVEAIVDRLVEIHEAELPQPWSAREVSREFKTKLLKAIVGFEIAIDRIEGKFKVGQNRPIEDQLSVADELARSPNAVGRELGKLIRAHQTPAHR